MSERPAALDGAPPAPAARFCVAVTGHRDGNATYSANRSGIEAALRDLFALIEAAVAECAATHAVAPTRLHTMLAAGTDQVAAAGALALGWELVVPLPFGLGLNAAINADPASVAEVDALLADPSGESGNCSAPTRQRAARIHALARQARVFALAEQDTGLAALLLATRADPADVRLATRFAAECSQRVAIAARVMIEQSDLMVAVWDGTSAAPVGGTGHTIQAALDAGTPVLWIDAHRPRSWRLLAGPEALAGCVANAASNAAADSAADTAAAPPDDALRARLRMLVAGSLRPPVGPDGAAHPAGSAGVHTLARETLHRHSHPWSHAYRRIEALFGATGWRRLAPLRQVYERPEAIATGSAARLLAQALELEGQDPEHVRRIDTAVLRRFAWADGVSAWLSDVYRGGMTANFLLAALAIIGGVAYLPWTDSGHKWPFALAELLLLGTVLAITAAGHRRRWHDRWLATRRIAEYLRHAPILLLFGVARAPGRWPRSTDSSWPEWYARQALRELGLPRLAVTPAYLRRALGGPLREHVVRQRDYHRAKAHRLETVHRNLDRSAELLFVAAVVSVASYLALKAGGAAGWWSARFAHDGSYHFTLLGVLLPTLGSAIAGIRYFGDFERFAAISRVTAGRLQEVDERITQLLAAPDARVDFGRAADLAHAMDEAVVSEIESWQSVFAGKRVAVPV
ncbi:MAG: hypothetical protein U1F30_12240 [Steroidobacteraceae bacterium]